jgi:hypothetical protein
MLNDITYITECFCRLERCTENRVKAEIASRNTDHDRKIIADCRDKEADAVLQIVCYFEATGGSGLYYCDNQLWVEAEQYGVKNLKEMAQM